MKLKTLGLILSVVAIIGIFESIGIMFFIQPFCESFMATYHQMLFFLIPIHIVILVAGSYLYFKQVAKRPARMRIFKQILTEDEKKIIDLVKKNENVTQAQLRRELPMSKAKLSMILEKMQQRNMVKKIKTGKTNTVVLAKRI